MTFSNEDIKQYQELCRRNFGEEIGEGQAIEEMSNLMFLVALMCRTPDDIDLERLQQAIEGKQP